MMVCSGKERSICYTKVVYITLSLHLLDDRRMMDNEDIVQLVTRTVDLSQIYEIYRDETCLLLFGGSSEIRLGAADSQALCVLLVIGFADVPVRDAPGDDLPDTIPF